MSERSRNRLAGETSPYLLQHADNPVDWYPWGPEALERARREDKPILLSIGYAACHWCHVMAHESFEDEETARVMNEHFVCVKVDREERPDLDAIYMDAVQAMTGQGGWPMTVFLTPDGAPFYAGTYFPKEDRHGLPAFRRVLEVVARAWRERRAEVLEQGGRVVQAIGRLSQLRASPEPLSEGILLVAHAGLRQSFDPQWGGFGGAPKFPQPMSLEFLLRCHLRGYAASLEMVTRTLDRMAAGGIRDHVGGGFHRYSVDARWHVPHFEKMLYDNAQLARLYARAWQVTADARYRQVAAETLDYLLRELRHPGGGFFSSQDADSEGEEGKFYVWGYDELVAVAREAVGSESLARAVATWFGALPEGNWEGGRNVLWTPLPPERVAEEARVTPEELAAAVEAARRRLFEVRERRVRPATDDKVLAAWNGLAISALAEAGRALGEPRYVEAAEAAARFVLTHLRREDGRLLRSWREGRTGVPGYSDDHALLAEGLLTLYETTFDLQWFEEARRLADELLRLFHDEEGGGFFQAGHDAEPLVVRPKEVYDNAVPSGNSAAAEVLQRLALLTGEPRYEQAGVSALRVVRDQLTRAPTMFGHALCALDLYLGRPREVAIVGELGAEDTRRLVAEVHGRFLPHTVLAVAPPGDRRAAEAVPLLRDRSPLDGRATAFVCERFACRRPVTDPAELAAELNR
ncbi:MAG TPA: thioredoxin domain-containing protein [Actinomycetota bacterium]|nr:thioredoxin domain-containing protein [Actinomycetota bacterium]